MVERGPEKAGVGGSIPSLATIFRSDHLQPRRVAGARAAPGHPARVRANAAGNPANDADYFLARRTSRAASSLVS